MSRSSTTSPIRISPRRWPFDADRRRPARRPAPPPLCAVQSGRACLRHRRRHPACGDQPGPADRPVVRRAQCHVRGGEHAQCGEGCAAGDLSDGPADRPCRPPAGARTGRHGRRGAEPPLAALRPPGLALFRARLPDRDVFRRCHGGAPAGHRHGGLHAGAAGPVARERLGRAGEGSDVRHRQHALALRARHTFGGARRADLEELVFRGQLFAALSKTRIGVAGTTVFTAALWSLMHLTEPWLAIGIIFMLGLAFGWMMYRFGSIWVPMICHGVWNSVYALAVFGQVSA
ncbi:MAG: CPBP family intramembrane metalloprotease [Hyphomicrobiales bacterium]|nr:MAG: CPBP family intramembrane metalloprotease [Hyphomicrobiales bacterium]